MAASSLNAERGGDTVSTEEKALGIVEHLHDDPKSLEKVKSRLSSFNWDS